MGFELLDLQLYVYDLWIVVCPFVLCLLTIVVSVLFRFVDSDYPFGICNYAYTMKVINNTYTCLKPKSN
jgi:hypothetical protein